MISYIYVPKDDREYIQNKRKEYGFNSQEKFTEYLNNKELYDYQKIDKEPVKKIESTKHDNRVKFQNAIAIIRGLNLQHDPIWIKILCKNFEEGNIKDHDDFLYIIKNAMVMPFGNWHQYYDSIELCRDKLFNYLDEAKRKGEYEFLKQVWIDYNFYLFTMIRGSGDNLNYWNKMVNHSSWLQEEADYYGDIYTWGVATLKKNWIITVRKKPKKSKTIEDIQKQMIEDLKNKPHCQELMSSIYSNLFGLKIRERDPEEAYHLIQEQWNYLDKVDNCNQIHNEILYYYAMGLYYISVSDFENSIAYLDSADKKAKKERYTRAEIYIAIAQVYIDLIRGKKSPEQIEEDISNIINSEPCERELRCLGYAYSEMAIALDRQERYGHARNYKKWANNCFNQLDINNNTPNKDLSIDKFL